MAPPKKDGMSGGGNAGKMSQNGELAALPAAPMYPLLTSTSIGNRSGFRTDAAISNSKFGNERTLQRWVPDADDTLDSSLERTSGGQRWDQFAANEKLFNVKSDYDEAIYTSSIDRNHPQYQQRVAAAERKAREIENSTASTAHVAEERVMDYVPGSDQGGENEEDK